MDSGSPRWAEWATHVVMPKLLDTASRADDLYGAISGLILRGGLGAVTLRAVARELGISTSPLRHHFDNRGRLMRFVLARSVRRLGPTGWASFPSGHKAGLLRARALLKLLLPLEEDQRTAAIVLYELLTAARTDQALSSASEHAEKCLSDECAVALAWIHQVSTPDLDPVELDLLVALMDGLRRRLSDPHADLSVDQALAVLHRHLDRTASRLDSAG